MHENQIVCAGGYIPRRHLLRIEAVPICHCGSNIKKWKYA
ncbi:hypothetical protein ANACOL_00768 [Anaerotruncus colihominis DSM 17241]|uniref:Uncharacterized protein n=1 Tax=Anaerotruncus colihominis DSM 17241 TaxID=445972 RepID=B0P7N3_9FIRM|nr:hypothetical protein ANACOL_00768 [Anaerotruncus colihominis DSM 17241]